MLIAVTVTTALYIFVILLSVSAYPEGCASWVDYITHLDRYKGIDRFPAFYAAHYYLGDRRLYPDGIFAGACVFQPLRYVARCQIPVLLHGSG